MVKIKEQFGRRDVYPIGDLGDKIKALTCSKTISHKQIEVLKELGFQFEVEKEDL
jgi:hypothetical protein